MKVAAALVAVYFIIGPTYLALRFGFEGFPPFLLNGFRFIIAGVLMYGVLLIRGAKHPSTVQWWDAAQMREPDPNLSVKPPDLRAVIEIALGTIQPRMYPI